MPELKSEAGSDFFFVEAANPEDGARKLIEIVQNRIPRRYGLDPVKDVQVLSPTNRGGSGARSLNVDLQQALNPPSELRVERFGWTFCVGDKVMKTENDYEKEVYNGDLGVITAINPQESEVLISYEGQEDGYDSGGLDRVVLAYATTIHKSQGSEYPAVVIPLTTQHWTMLRRDLVYTGVTRGKRLVVIVGQKRALGLAIRARSEGRRWSKLKEWRAGTRSNEQAVG